VPVSGAWVGGGGGFSVLVHGGAGELSDARKPACAEGCRRAVVAAKELLQNGGAALDAVQRAVEILEADPLFNAGTGSCLTADGGLELDAAIMDGERLRAGAVCALPAFQHPIRVARAVLDAGRHVLYAGEGAALFAEQAGFVRADEASMITAAARERLAKLQAAGPGGGTVGAVARDRMGNVAAATSTGGMVGKRRGRVGDSPIPGAGTYADNTAGAVSATGDGEGILRIHLAGQLVAALHAGVDLASATRRAIQTLADRVNAQGGVIAVDTAGTLALARSTRAMSWAAGWEGADVLCGA